MSLIYVCVYWVPACAGMTPEQYVTDWLSLTTEELSRVRIAVLPVAAVEQHGPHLPVGTDTYIAEACLARVRALLPESSPSRSCRCSRLARRTSIGRFAER